MINKTFNVGLVGTGYITDYHAKALSHVPGVRWAGEVGAEHQVVPELDHVVQ
jgi:hypothetical protein